MCTSYVGGGGVASCEKGIILELPDTILEALLDEVGGGTQIL